MAKVVGTIQDIDLEFVDGIYRDRSTDRSKTGYWVRTWKEGKVTKTYIHELPYQHFVVIKAASHFNQTVRCYMG